MGWKISDKPTVDPKDADLALIEQDGNTRNTTWAKLKAFFLGTATLATTDQTIKGAINEVKASTDANTTSLSKNTQQIINLNTLSNREKIIIVTEPYNQITKTNVNLGFKPKSVNILACIISSKYDSNGYTDTMATYSKYTTVSTGTVDLSLDSISFYYNVDNNLCGKASLTDTGLEITWTLTGELIGVADNMKRRLLISAV